MAIGGICLVGFFGWHGLLERLSRHLEVDHDAYLWRTEEWLQLFTPTNYVDRGAHRILLTGSSEAREGFVPEPFEEALPGWEAYQNATSFGVIGDIPLILEYIEAAYGRGAMPEKVVVGAAFRMAMSHIPGLEDTPLMTAIDRYSPSYSLDLESRPRRLVPKDAVSSLVSRFRLLGHRSERYRRALAALVTLGVKRLAGEPPGDWRRDLELVAARYGRLDPRPKERYRETPSPYPRMALIRPSARATTLRRGFDEIRSIAGRHDTRIYVVNLPEGPWMATFYDGGVYEEYRSLLREAAGDYPYLDLRWFLREEEFYDWAHPTAAGARRLSERIARFIVETDHGRAD